MVAKVEWHPGELIPRVGFIVTNLARPAERVVAFYNQRGTCEQWIKEGKGAIKWTRLSCRTFAANAVRLQLHALAYNLGNFLRTLAMPKPIKEWSLTSLREKLIKIGAKVVSHGRYVTFQMAEVAVSRQMFQEIFCGSLPNCGRRLRLHRQVVRAARSCQNAEKAQKFMPVRDLSGKFPASIPELSLPGGQSCVHFCCRCCGFSPVRRSRRTNSLGPTWMCGPF